MNKLLFTLPLALLLGCQKDDPDPVDQLPLATQTGANTFGCLINGQPWTPKGNDGTSNYTVSYDPTYHNGNLDIRVYNIKSKNKFQYIIIGGDDISSLGAYSLTKFPRTVYFIDNTKPAACQEYDGLSSQYCRGSLTMTRLDLRAGIVSGTFAFTLYKPGCDSVRVTQGRFDKRL